MKHSLPIPLLAALGAMVAVLSSASQAQGPIYRCGNEYTNAVSEAQKSHCKLVEGGNITVVQGFRAPVAAAGQPVRVAAAGAGAPIAGQSGGVRVDATDQKSRDSEARQILEGELRKAEARQNELAREYNNGEPEKRGDEARNYQKYLDRVAEIKASLARNESDINGIRRELVRVPAAK